MIPIYGLEKISTIIDNLIYLEKHLLNIQRAFDIVVDVLSDEPTIYHDHTFFSLMEDVKFHDMSKFSKDEFIQYTDWFFGENGIKSNNPDEKNKSSFLCALDNHYKKNPHHWQNWSLNEADKEINIIHMLIDWIAVQMEFGGNVRNFYLKNKKVMNLSIDDTVFLERLIDKLDKSGY
jgi:hypothetical protein